VEVLVESCGGEMRTLQVTGPMGEPVEAFFGVLPDGTAVIEMAAAAGLPLVPPERRDPTRTTTYGVGELIKAALDEGCRTIIVGVGGSATNDAGAGMAQALGAKLLDREGKQIGFGGLELLRLERIDLSGMDPRIKEAKFIVASDVNNPLYGPEGAAYVYAPQKGATPAQVAELDRALRKFAEVVERDLGKEIADLPGAGAAGGLGAGLVAFLDAELRMGAAVVMEVTEFERKIQGADLIITGEGKVDSQVKFGKALLAVGRMGQKHGIPVVAIAGQVDEDAEVVFEYGITATFSMLQGPTTLEEAMRRQATLLARETQNVVRLFLSAKFGRDVSKGKGGHGQKAS
ncbi:MAG TPA: glycerate kinase, partial [Armatimonadetes bacterium]|nr:glycerate kinase [Armatimonadota bacterium]